MIEMYFQMWFVMMTNKPKEPHSFTFLESMKFTFAMYTFTVSKESIRLLCLSAVYYVQAYTRLTVKKNTTQYEPPNNMYMNMQVYRRVISSIHTNTSVKLSFGKITL